jgi:hypothetical protein
MILKVSTSTYHMNLQQLKEFFAAYLKVNSESLSMNFKMASVGDERFGNNHEEVVGIELTIDHSKLTNGHTLPISNQVFF